VCLRFAYLVAVRIVSTLRLWRRGGDHKAIEILLLRHQLAVLRRQLAATGKRPRPDWADRAVIALLLGLVPKARRAALRVFVTPDTVLRRHRDLLRRRWAKKSRPKNGRRPRTGTSSL
jgi:putative transposase